MHPRAPVVCLILFSSSFPSLSQLIEWLLKSKTYFKRLIGPPKNLRVTSLSFQNPWSFQDPGSHFGFVNILLSDFCPLSPLSSRFMQILQYRQATSLTTSRALWMVTIFLPSLCGRLTQRLKNPKIVCSFVGSNFLSKYKLSNMRYSPDRRGHLLFSKLKKIFIQA